MDEIRDMQEHSPFGDGGGWYVVDMIEASVLNSVSPFVAIVVAAVVVLVDGGRGVHEKIPYARICI